MIRAQSRLSLADSDMMLAARAATVSSAHAHSKVGGDRLTPSTSAMYWISQARVSTAEAALFRGVTLGRGLHLRLRLNLILREDPDLLSALATQLPQLTGGEVRCEK